MNDSAVQGIAGHDERVENKRGRTRRGFRIGVGALLLSGAFLFSTSAEAQVQSKTAIKKQNVKSETVKDAAKDAAKNQMDVRKVDPKHLPPKISLPTQWPNVMESLNQQHGSGLPASSSSSSSSSSESISAEATQKRSEINKWQQFDDKRPTGFYKADVAIKYVSGDYICPTVDDVKRLFDGAVIAAGKYKAQSGWFVAANEKDLEDAMSLAKRNQNLRSYHLFIPEKGYKNGSSRMNTGGFFWTRTKEGGEHYYWYINNSKKKIEFVGGDDEYLENWSFPILPIKK